MHFFFDLNKQLAKLAPHLYGQIKGIDGLNCKSNLGQISFPTGLEAVHLQAADLLAYLTYQFLEERIDNDKADLGPLLRKALSNAKDPKHFPLFNEEGIRHHLAGTAFEMKEGI